MGGGGGGLPRWSASLKTLADRSQQARLERREPEKGKEETIDDGTGLREYNSVNRIAIIELDCIGRLRVS